MDDPGYFNRSEAGFLPPHPELSRSPPQFSVWASCSLALGRGCWSAPSRIDAGRPQHPSFPSRGARALGPRGPRAGGGGPSEPRPGRARGGAGAGVPRVARSGAGEASAGSGRCRRGEWAGPRGGGRGAPPGSAAARRPGIRASAEPAPQRAGRGVRRAASRAGAGREAAAAPCAGEEPGAGRQPAGGGWGPRQGVPERRRRRRQRRLSRVGAWVRGSSGSARWLRCERAARLPSSPARRRRCDWVEDGAGRMEILMTVSKFASICTMVGEAGGCGRPSFPPSPPAGPSAGTVAGRGRRGPGGGGWTAGRKQARSGPGRLAREGGRRGRRGSSVPGLGRGSLRRRAVGARAGPRARPGPEVEVHERRPVSVRRRTGSGPAGRARRVPSGRGAAAGRQGPLTGREGTEVGSGFLPAPLARPSPRRRRGEGGVCEGGNFK